MEENNEDLHKHNNEENLILEMFNSAIKDNTEQKILELIVKNKTPEEMIDELISQEI